MPRRDFTALRKLRDEDPAICIRLLRLLWPDIHAALERGHTIRLIRERLGEAGISISYRQLCRYVARLRGEAESRDRSNRAPGEPGHKSGDEVGGKPEDPLARIRERLVREKP